jgi:hypothetical protein
MLPRDWGPIYRLGRVVMTPSARATVSDQDLATALLRHLRRTWGEEDDCYRRVNQHPNLNGCRILSACCARNRARFWIITEADRKLTTVLLPNEYSAAGDGPSS